MMHSCLLPTKPLADALLRQVKAHAAKLNPQLHIVQVGEDAASSAYIKAKSKAAKRCGIAVHTHNLPQDVEQKQLDMLLHHLNADARVSAVVLQLPLPAHLNARHHTNVILPEKDVDGLTALNCGRLALNDPAALIPATPLGVLRILQWAEVKIFGSDVTVIGRSNLVGWPMATLLSRHGATVTVCHKDTRDLVKHLQQADIIVAAAGAPELVKGSHVKPNAVLIDVGTTPASHNGRRVLLGDIRVPCSAEKARLLTPVPGGVGPMTVASLMTNVIDAACLQQGIEKPVWEVTG